MAMPATKQWRGVSDCFDNGNASRRWDSNGNAETIHIDNQPAFKKYKSLIIKK